MTDCRRIPGMECRRGFTLIELIVVMTIVAVLICMVLPAIQQAREVARRSACKNNLRQIGIAMHAYHEAYSQFPIGARRQMQGFGTSWWVGLLPYLDQAPLYQQFNHTLQSSGLNPNNPALKTNAGLPFMLCSSSPLAAKVISTLLGPVVMPHYAGIAGATNTGNVAGNNKTFADDGFSFGDTSNCCAPYMDGRISGRGVLIPGRGIAIHEIIDGSSRTICVGEISDSMRSVSGGEIRIDAGYPNGWACGTTSDGTPPSFVMRTSTAVSNPSYAFNITTLRYPIDTRDAALPGIHKEGGPNNPLLSAHYGGAQCLFADGSAHLYGSSVDLRVFKLLCTRNDSQTVANP